jgi:hypothetical protein
MSRAATNQHFGPRTYGCGISKGSGAATSHRYGYVRLAPKMRPSSMSPRASVQNPCYHTRVYHPQTGWQPGYVCPSGKPMGPLALPSQPTPGMYGSAGRRKGHHQ